MDDPLLAWREAFVVAGYEVESLTTDDVTRAFVAWGMLGNHRLVLWRGFYTSTFVLVETPHLKDHRLLRTWQKAPSGGTTSVGWLAYTAWGRRWRFSDFTGHHIGFIQSLSAIRAVACGDATVDVDTDDHRHYFLRDRLTAALLHGPKLATPASWVNVEQMPAPPRRP